MNRLLNSRTTALISKHAQYNITNAEATVSNHIYKYCKRMYATATKKPTPKLLILMGPPGAGKGTQARFLTDFSIIGAGDTLREESQHNEDVKQLLARGELASEELIATLLAKKVVSILSNEESEKNETPEKTNATVDTPTETTPQSILDIQHPGIVKTNNIIVEGYPRNREQGSKLMDMFSETGFRKQSTLVLHLMCDKDTIKKRLKGRLIDVPSGRTYHVEYRPPKQDQLDDVTQRPLTRRDDDSITEVIQNRLETYKDKTLPTIEMLTENGLTVLDIPSSGSIESVHERIKKEVLSFFKVPASKEAPKEAAKEVLKEGPKEEQKEVPKEAEKEAAKSEK